MIAFFADLTIWHWLALAGVLLVFEVMSGTTYLLWPAAAAVSSALALHFGVGWEMQLVVFAAVTVALTVLGASVVRPRLRRVPAGALNLNRRADQLIGRRAKVASAFEAGRGSVDVAGSLWRAELEAGAIPPAPGALVEITAVDGLVLKVKRAD